MSEQHRSAEHWDSVYEEQRPKNVAEDDEVGLAALAHFGGVDGARLLDLGCGTGEYTRFFAARGARVLAIDQSPVAIETLHRQCADAGLDTVEGVVADAMDLERLGPFDLAFGSMILHHIEPFDRFVDVLGNSLRPGGRAFFYENSAMSSFLVWCREHLVGRFGIPKNSDDDEFPLQPREIDELRTRFDVTVEHPHVVLTSLAAGYLFRDHLGKQLDWVDQQLGRIDRIRRMSYLQNVKLVAHVDLTRPEAAPHRASTTAPISS
jgi:2-polyprenyl-3-methyl-5-hydroxy-6-metoxy-1,4-benzoquinol methylase